MSERREPERSGPKMYVSRSRAVSGSRKNRAQQSGAQRGAVSEDHRNGNAERQNSPLRSAPMLCTGVIESVLRK